MIIDSGRGTCGILWFFSRFLNEEGVGEELEVDFGLVF